jgi:hypothetical protein
MVRIGILAMAAAITIICAGSWLHASVWSSRPLARASIDILTLTLSTNKQLATQAFDAI